MGWVGRWGTATPTPMLTETLLTLTQILASTYPVGAFAYSHGLERLATDGTITPDRLGDWLTDVLDHGAGRADAILLALAATTDAATDLNDYALALAPTRERRQETLHQGAAFAATTRAVWGIDVADMAYPVAVGRAARLLDLPSEPVTAVWLQGVAANLIQCALRLMPLGQTAGQRILHDLTPLIGRIAAEAQHAALDDIGSAAFVTDIGSMRHETQYSRIFRS